MALKRKRNLKKTHIRRQEMLLFFVCYNVVCYCYLIGKCENGIVCIRMVSTSSIDIMPNVLTYTLIYTHAACFGKTKHTCVVAKMNCADDPSIKWSLSGMDSMHNKYARRNRQQAVGIFIGNFQSLHTHTAYILPNKW